MPPQNHAVITPDVLLDHLKALVADEQAVIDGLRARATGLAGFGGVLVALAAGRLPAAFNAPLSVRIIAICLFSAALVSVTIGVGMLVRVIAPRGAARNRPTLTDVAKWPEYVGDPSEPFTMQEVNRLVHAYDLARQVGDSLTRLLRHATIPIATGIVLLVLESIFVALFVTNVV